MILFVFWLALFNWSADQVEYVGGSHSIIWIVFQDLSCYAFLLRLTDFFCLTPISWNRLFQWLTSLNKMTSEITYGTLNFMNIYLLKVNSVHLSGAKHICHNFWLLESWVFDFEFWFWDLRRLCPEYVMRPSVTEHVPLHSKSSCKKYCTCIWGV